MLRVLRADRALATSVTVAVLGWIAAGAATSWVALNPNVLHPAVYLLWLHSFAIVATMTTVALVVLRAFRHMIGDTKLAYSIGLEHGIDIRDSMADAGHENLGGSTPSTSETRKAPAVAGAFRGQFAPSSTLPAA